MSKAPPTPTHSNTNRPEKCWIPICRVWVVEGRKRERETEGEREAGVCSVFIMQRDGERDRGR